MKKKLKKQIEKQQQQQEEIEQEMLEETEEAVERDSNNCGNEDTESSVESKKGCELIESELCKSSKEKTCEENFGEFSEELSSQILQEKCVVSGDENKTAEGKDESGDLDCSKAFLFTIQTSCDCFGLV